MDNTQQYPAFQEPTRTKKWFQKWTTWAIIVLALIAFIPRGGEPAPVATPAPTVTATVTVTQTPTKAPATTKAPAPVAKKTTAAAPNSVLQMVWSTMSAADKQGVREAWALTNGDPAMEKIFADSFIQELNPILRSNGLDKITEDEAIAFLKWAAKN